MEINSGTYTSAVTVNGNGTLGGNGSLGSSVTVSSFTGTVAPGSSTGTLTVAGEKDAVGELQDVMGQMKDGTRFTTTGPVNSVFYSDLMREAGLIPRFVEARDRRCEHQRVPDIRQHSRHDVRAHRARIW